MFFSGGEDDFSPRARTVIYMLEDDSEEALKKTASKIMPEAEKLAKSMGIKLGELYSVSSTMAEDRDHWETDEKEGELPEGPKSRNPKVIEIKARISASFLIKK